MKKGTKEYKAFYGLKRTFLMFLNKYFFKIPLGEKLPDWILWIFYPIETWLSKQNQLRIDYEKNTLIYDNIEIGIELFNKIKNQEYQNTYFNFKKINGIIKINHTIIKNME